MNRRLALAVLLLVPCALLLRGGSATPQILSDAPVKDFRLPTFTKENWTSSFLHADTAHILSQTQIDVTGLTLTLFANDATKHVDTVFVSPAATLHTEQDRESVHGPQTVRLVRDDLEVTGEQWSYFYREKRVLIEKNVRVVFHAKLPDLLK